MLIWHVICIECFVLVDTVLFLFLSDYEMGSSVANFPLTFWTGTKLVNQSNSVFFNRFDRENTNLKNQLSQSCGNFEFDDSSSEGEEGLLYDDLGNGNRLSLIGPDNSVSFGSISNIKSKWEDDKNAAPLSRKEELARQRKEEIQMIRARQCQVGCCY